jgi:hypothetical protein
MKTALFLICGFIAITSMNCSRKCSPYILSPGGQSMIQSYRELVSSSKNVYNCNETSTRKTLVTQSAMLSAYLYPSAKASGYLTFPTFCIATGEDVAGSDKQHFYSTFSGRSHLGYSYYFGQCPPTNFSVGFGGDPDITPKINKMPVVYPYPDNFTNEVYASQLIPISSYEIYRSTATDITEGVDLGKAKGIVNALAVADIEEIKEAYIEDEGGFISRSQKANYDRLDSSKGVVVVVKKKGVDKPIPCYIINNYDTGSLTWKMLHICSQVSN